MQYLLNPPLLYIEKFLHILTLLIKIPTWAPILTRTIYGTDDQLAAIPCPTTSITNEHCLPQRPHTPTPIQRQKQIYVLSQII